MPDRGAKTPFVVRPRFGRRPPAAHAHPAPLGGAPQRQDVLERGLREGPAGGRGELVGHLAGRRGQRLRRHRPRVLQAGAGRAGRAGGVARRKPSSRSAPLRSASPDEDRARRLDRFAVSAAERSQRRAVPTSRPSICRVSTSSRCRRWAKGPGRTWRALDDRLANVRGYYRFVDQLIGEAAAGRDPEDVLVLLGDPGRLARSGDGPAVGNPPPRGRAHRAPGIWVPFRSGTWRRPSST